MSETTEAETTLRPTGDELRARLGGVLFEMQNAALRNPMDEEQLSAAIDDYDEALAGLIYEANRHIPEVFTEPYRMAWPLRLVDLTPTLDAIERRAVADKTHWRRGALWALQRVRRALTGP